jgi:2-keto-4-pentenoate hydratase/2-oxohepta-3-ene-1,7-dioic acid hydratase in catechol pathway
LKLQKAVGFLLLIPIFGCSAMSQSETGKQQSQREISATSIDAEANIVGGFAKADLSDPNVKEAAAFALQGLRSRAAGKSSWEIVTAETQVVAGLNYRFRAKELGSNRSAEAVVYRNLEGPLFLTSIEFFD